MEPVFGELRDRQRQLERSLTELEVDDNKNSVALRLKELDGDVSLIHARQGALQGITGDAEPVQGGNGQGPDRAGAAAVAGGWDQRLDR